MTIAASEIKSIADAHLDRWFADVDKNERDQALAEHARYVAMMHDKGP